MLEKITLKIRRKESPFYSFLYDLAFRAQRFRVPDLVIPLYRVLYYERSLLIHLFRRFVTFLYYEPLFRSRCKEVGKGFRYVKLRQGFPYFSGNLELYIGDNVAIHSRSSFSATKVYDHPVFKVGNDTYLGPGLSIGVAREIIIGNHCHLASNISISDNDGHPIDPLDRVKNEPVNKNDVKPVHIDDYVWIGEGASILKGVTIGKCAIIASRSIVTNNVEPYSIVAGNPARFIKWVAFKNT